MRLPDDLDTDEHGFWAPLDEDGKRRLRQIARYLAAHWPTPYPVQLRIERLSARYGCVGETYRKTDPDRPDSHTLVVRVDSRACLSWAIDTLLHEHAHCATWPASVRWERKQDRYEHPNHPAEWRAIYGEIIAHMDDDGGLELSETW